MILPMESNIVNSQNEPKPIKWIQWINISLIERTMEMQSKCLNGAVNNDFPVFPMISNFKTHKVYLMLAYTITR